MVQGRIRPFLGRYDGVALRRSLMRLTNSQYKSTPYPNGTDPLMAQFLTINCQATITQSLWVRSFFSRCAWSRPRTRSLHDSKHSKPDSGDDQGNHVRSSTE